MNADELNLNYQLQSMTMKWKHMDTTYATKIHKYIYKAMQTEIWNNANPSQHESLENQRPQH